MNEYHFDWSELAFGSKKPINELNAYFIVAPRKMSKTRLSQLIKEYLPKGNIVFGLAKEDYVLGFEGQPQFRTLSDADLEPLLIKTNSAKVPHHIYSLLYFQRDTKFLIEKLKFKEVILINGSWKYMLHTLPIYYSLVSNKTPYVRLSPFVSESEALGYEKITMPAEPVFSGSYTETEMLGIADDISKWSFDYCFQTGVALGCRTGKKYSYLASSYNRVVPYQTYAMHHGSLRENNFSPMNDLNFYDTIHAEVELLVRAQKQKIDLKGTTLFINLLPCPTCARMFCETDIEEFVYREDHSDGYAVKLLETAGKKVTRLVQ